ncbi:MAG: PQQ-binding-like beta-propeller repeat protein [Acidobacteria bacterium]|nr:PQQ-binding-like beta-propeller repeat protein [Acidobacteriota bacterium]
MHTSPAVASDLLFIGSCTGTFYALDKINGRDDMKPGPDSPF